ncbi:hypothetical protein MMC30_003690 [Trapelia coarctata]|nr:hypothetical protein [Trapelia coarctata]
MIPAFIALLAILLHYHLGSAIASPPRTRSSSAAKDSSRITCNWYLLRGGPRATDCYAAIDMIPSGDLLVEGDFSIDSNGAPILNMLLPPSARARKFYMPAIFRSGNCMVRVVADVSRRKLMRPNPPEFKNAASKMYSIVWPNVRAQATKVVQQCFEQKQGMQYMHGTVKTESLLGKVWFPYKITIEEPHEGFPGDGATYIDLENIGPNFNTRGAWEIEYNVYEPGGTSSGQGHKGEDVVRGKMGKQPVYHGLQR